MIKVHDNRATDERMLKDIEIDGYFMLDGVLCRRITTSDEFRWSSDGIPIIEISIGIVSLFKPTTWVIPIRNEQMCVSIEDWG